MLPETYQSFVSDAVKCAPRECCGLIYRDSTSNQELYFSCRNIADREDDFAIHPDDWLACEALGKVMAVCHSHPEASSRASSCDVVGCNDSGIPWFILGCDGLNRIDPEGYDLTGRPFEFGWADCWTLIRDWASDGWPDFARTWETAPKLIKTHMREMGWVEVDDAKPGDVILMRIRSVHTNHCAAYLGAGTILHHQVGKLSGTDMLGPYLDRISHIFRRPR